MDSDTRGKRRAVTQASQPYVSGIPIPNREIATNQPYINRDSGKSNKQYENHNYDTAVSAIDPPRGAGRNQDQWCITRNYATAVVFALYHPQKKREKRAAVFDI